MERMENEKGFTLVEIMIVIVIISIGIGMASYGINIVFGSRMDSYSSQFKSDLRYIRDQNMSIKDGNYRIDINFTSNEITSYRTYHIAADSTIVQWNTIQLNNKITMSVVLEDGTTPPSDGTITIRFDSSSGEVSTGLNGYNGAGTYTFTSTATGETESVTLTRLTGRID
ncbi:MAG: hypothetical protein CVU84_00170 [Firmicutes bacterium HGW-Firmicutes-1]|jgi:prepilin-type N-terminal cleavage/methylation domain-containing protein|nr:MAG: hypothetical protein CVU84_00170 [Firmicutes bacterium HGW-Firmicutes-1]